MAIFKSPTTINAQEVLIPTNLGVNTAFAFANTVSNTSAIVVAGNSAVSFTFSEITVGELSSNAQFADLYTITSNVSNVNEGASVSFNVTSLADPGETLYWTVSGTDITDGDFSSPSNTVSVGGSITLVSGTSSVVLTLAEDTTTEGTENFNFNVRTGNAAGPIVASSSNTVINDTSVTLKSQAQGTNFGYTSGGAAPSSTRLNTIDKYPFASNANATDVGDLTVARNSASGQSSDVSGYTSGGVGPARVNVIDKFPFASNANATDVGNLRTAITATAGQSSDISGYTTGGVSSTPPPVTVVNTIEKFSFSVDANATDVGDLTQSKFSGAGQSSTVNGYMTGGSISIVIEKFPFSSDTNATDVGDLTVARADSSGQSSYTHGYASGGASGPAPLGINVIDKFPFASDANATDVGNLLDTITGTGGQSSDVSGYTSGGVRGTSTFQNVIQKFPFASNTNATDVGDLTLARSYPAGQQY